jgi:predicted SnoaL-like aldol condensation-catalyzing enzyme
MMSKLFTPANIGALYPRALRRYSEVYPDATLDRARNEMRVALARPTPRVESEMTQTIEEKNKALVLEAFNTLFNKRDYAAAERYWSPDYIQHSAHIEPGREGLFTLIKSTPSTLKYEPGRIVAEGNFVIVHGRFSGLGKPANWIAADILRIEDGILVEHWDVIQDEATARQSKSGKPMFGDRFPE